jgi:hypothetical protein
VELHSFAEEICPNVENDREKVPRVRVELFVEKASAAASRVRVTRFNRLSEASKTPRADERSGRKEKSWEPFY